jgi:hypothetical protein
MEPRLPSRRAAPSQILQFDRFDIHTDAILTLDDPDLFKYPVAFMWFGF